MLNHLQTETLAYDRQQNFLAEAEARRLTKLIAQSHPKSYSRPHPLLTWLMIVDQSLLSNWQRSAAYSRLFPARQDSNGFQW